MTDPFVLPKVSIAEVRASSEKGRNGSTTERLQDSNPRHQGPEQEPEPSAAPSVRGEKLLQRLENGPLYLDRLVHRFLPPALNPFAQLGAIANTCLLIAVISGIGMLLWYTPSVSKAHASLEVLRNSSWLGQLVRSLHRYSSDACMFVILLHAFRIVTSRRITGPRWLGWVTGVALLALTWTIGWTGYWLVWDVRAQHIATGTARIADALPLFVEPLSRSFLTNESVHSLLFFIVFFLHMLLPLAVGIALWMHLMRVNRAKLFTSRPMTLWVLGTLFAVSLLVPALSAPAAQMTVKSPQFTMDWWYLWPLALTDRLGGGALWTLLFLGTLAFATVPWWMAKRRAKPRDKAQVELARCIGCSLCSKDCPFNAITMVAREDGRKFAVQARVDPAKCVACGVCTGACDSEAIQLPWLDSKSISKRLGDWIDETVRAGDNSCLAFVCAESAPPSSRQSAPALHGYHVTTVPCVGWVSSLLVERALKRGAAGILIVGCGEGDPHNREGATWLQRRLNGTREPKLDVDKIDSSRVRFVHCDRTQRGELERVARKFRESVSGRASVALPADTLPANRRGRVARVCFAVVLATGLAAVTAAFTLLPYRTPHADTPELIVSFKHKGQPMHKSQAISAEEAAKLPAHMRRKNEFIQQRRRAPVRLQVHVDDKLLLDRTYKPRGLSSDGPSLAIERLPVPAGAHHVRVAIADGADPEEWTQKWDQRIEFSSSRSAVVLFDTAAGFSLH